MIIRIRTTTTILETKNEPLIESSNERKHLVTYLKIDALYPFWIVFELPDSSNWFLGNHSRGKQLVNASK